MRGAKEEALEIREAEAMAPSDPRPQYIIELLLTRDDQSHNTTQNNVKKQSIT
jgi:hypothetical protein